MMVVNIRDIERQKEAHRTIERLKASVDFETDLVVTPAESEILLAVIWSLQNRRRF